MNQTQMIGDLVRQARLRIGKSIQECAQALSCDAAFLTQVEEGTRALTLPQLEILALVLKVSLACLLGQEPLPEKETPRDAAYYRNMMLIRRRIIGVLLRQARLEMGQTLDDLAALLNRSPEYLARVELGDNEISFVELEIWADNLGVLLETFVADDIIALTAEERARRTAQRLIHLSSDIRDFVLMPINTPYLQVAMNLSQMPAETLRQIASGLLEITY